MTIGLIALSIQNKHTIKISQSVSRDVQILFHTIYSANRWRPNVNNVLQRKACHVLTNNVKPARFLTSFQLTVT